mgnify:CR=1 FL=1
MKYVIISIKHTDMDNHPCVLTLWGPNFSGYTIDLNKAGRYDLEDITRRYGHCPDFRFITTEEINNSSFYSFYIEKNWSTIVVPEDDLERLGLTKKLCVCL